MSAYLQEMTWLMRRGAPMSATQLFYTLLMPSTLAFCGTLGTENLDAAGLAISVYQLSVENCATAIRWGLMPFLAQTMGGSKKYRVGNYVQRGLLAALILTVFNWVVAINSANLLILIGQDPGIAIKCEQFLLILMPGCMGMNLNEALVAYADTVGYLWPTFVVRCIVLLVNLTLHYVLIFHANMGLAGSATALSISLALMPILQTFFIWKFRIHAGTWGGFTARAFVDWRKFFLTMLPCLVTQTFWIFGTEVGNFLAGLMGKSEIAAESVLFQLNMVAFLLPIGLGAALIARIGFYLGSRQPDKALRVIGIAMVAMCITGILIGCLFILLRHEVPKLFSLDAESTDLFVSLAPYLAVYTGFQLAAYPSVAALRACSYHKHTMIMNFIAYYAVSMPIGVSLAFAAGWQLRGLWVGFVLASTTFFLLPTVYMLCMDWEKKSNEASACAELETDMELLQEKQPLLGNKSKEEQLIGSQACASNQLSVSVNIRSRAAVRSKAPVLVAALLLLGASVATRLLLPPQAVASGDHSAGVANATSASGN